jgi:hypothetical protein
MAKKNEIPPAIGDRALEMVMRDVLDQMEEMFLESGFSPADGGFEIIEIAPERPAIATQATEDSDSDQKGAVIEFPQLRAVG